MTNCWTFSKIFTWQISLWGCEVISCNCLTTVNVVLGPFCTWIIAGAVARGKDSQWFTVICSSSSQSPFVTSKIIGIQGNQTANMTPTFSRGERCFMKCGIQLQWWPMPGQPPSTPKPAFMARKENKSSGTKNGFHLVFFFVVLIVCLINSKYIYLFLWRKQI